MFMIAPVSLCAVVLLEMSACMLSSHILPSSVPVHRRRRSVYGMARVGDLGRVVGAAMNSQLQLNRGRVADHCESIRS